MYKHEYKTYQGDKMTDFKGVKTILFGNVSIIASCDKNTLINVALCSPHHKCM